MNLKQLLEKAAPRPWIADDCHIHCKEGFAYESSIVEDDVVCLIPMDTRPHELMTERDRATQALIIHAVSMLPKLVEALQRYHEIIAGAGARPLSFDEMRAAEAILTEANNPEVK